MKYCPKKIVSYEGVSGVDTTVHYVEYSDVEKFHGNSFAKQWFSFIKKTPKFYIDNKEYFYYADYKINALRTAQYLNYTL